MKRKRRMKLKVKSAFVGKVRLEDGKGSVVLDENTPQQVLSQYFDTEMGQGFIEVDEKPVSKPDEK